MSCSLEKSKNNHEIWVIKDRSHKKEEEMSVSVEKTIKKIALKVTIKRCAD